MMNLFQERHISSVDTGLNGMLCLKIEKGSHLCSNFLCHIKEILYICSANKNIPNSKIMTDKDSHNCANTQIENLDGEVWKDVVGYEGLYQVSNMGRVKSVKRTVSSTNPKQSWKTINERILRSAPYGQPLKCGGKRHLGVVLYSNGKHKTEKVHRLVAMAFIPNPNNYPIINHKDENPANNKVSNLEWCDQKYNLNYGGRKERWYRSIPTTPVFQYSISGQLIARYKSVAEAARIAKISRGQIHKACSGDGCHKAAGYIWRYVNPKPQHIARLEKMRQYKLSTSVVQMKTDGEVVAIYDSFSDAAKAVGCKSPSSIHNAVSGKAKTSCGFKWMRYSDFLSQNPIK